MRLLARLETIFFYKSIYLILSENRQKFKHFLRIKVLEIIFDTNNAIKIKLNFYSFSYYTSYLCGIHYLLFSDFLNIIIIIVSDTNL